MRKKTIAGLAIILFFMAILTTSALAGFEEIYMTDSSGSFTEKLTPFAWDDTPWLYLKLPDTGWNVTWAWWEDHDSQYSFSNSMPSGEQDIWLTIDNWSGVGGARKSGEWNVNAYYSYANNPSNPMGSGSTNFAVTPEPVSSILFLTGAGLLAIRRKYSKRKKS